MIYLDHHATTPLDERVLDAMLPYLRENFGNPASPHRFGTRAKEGVEKAREQTAALVGGRPSEIVFTSGATESDNLAIMGTACARHDEGRDHVITQVTEHPAVLDTVSYLQEQGCRVTRLPVDKNGIVDLDALKDALDEKTSLVSVMLTNNEIGTVQPMAEIGALAREVGAWVHCDGAQGLGYIPLNVRETPVDMISLSGHKIYGPKGVGALWVRKDSPRVTPRRLMLGGSQENGQRSGTLNVPGIVGLGEAAEIQREHGPSEAIRMRGIAKTLLGALKELGNVSLNGLPIGEGRHPGNVNVSVEGIDSLSLLLRLKNSVAISTGSACGSSKRAASHVLEAIGANAGSSIRFGLGRSTTEAVIDQAIRHVTGAITEMREASPEWRMRDKEIRW